MRSYSGCRRPSKEGVTVKPELVGELIAAIRKVGDKGNA